MKLHRYASYLQILGLTLFGIGGDTIVDLFTALPGFCRVESGGSSSGMTADVAVTVVALPAKNWQWRP